MSNKLEVAWLRLLQSIQAFWKGSPAKARHDATSSAAEQISNTVTASDDLPMPPPQPAVPPPPRPYRRTPDPAFGSRSAAQREAYARRQQEREEAAERDAAQHSRDRQHRPDSSQTRH